MGLRCLGKLGFLGTHHTVPVWVDIFNLLTSGHCPKLCGMDLERLADVPGSQAEQVMPWLWLEHEIKRFVLSFPTELLEQVWGPAGRAQVSHSHPS